MIPKVRLWQNHGDSFARLSVNKSSDWIYDSEDQRWHSIGALWVESDGCGIRCKNWKLKKRSLILAFKLCAVHYLSASEGKISKFDFVILISVIVTFILFATPWIFYVNNIPESSIKVFLFRNILIHLSMHVHSFHALLSHLIKIPQWKVVRRINKLDYRPTTELKVYGPLKECSLWFGSFLLRLIFVSMKAIWID
jgi:hypothetical protein